ncbi:MAG: hypothetical protein A2234_11045 [Elusimicrobia bacterium RIFOXYA2_FULL_58_8]|nr:MAG: hypothetical protein A2285_10375 [Elusimicrobia bacterium RIFOXYA12_FULL_57_11]OGS14554.1 MAG: hypothetical protein A2234_11045 [Elusimicrobia bacterium RIFOXYA2_FULL_58_8]
MNRKDILAFVLVAALAGYGSAAQKNGKSGLVTLTMPDGSRVEAELALTPQAQTRGLMFKETMPDKAGMLFVFADDEIRTFWMKNTYVSLDIVFLDGDMKVRNVFHRVPRSNPSQPEAEVAKVSAPAKFVLELAAGKARKSRLQPGSVIKVYPPVAAVGGKRPRISTATTGAAGQ